MSAEKGKKGDNRNSLYVDLDKSMSNADYERAVKICNRLLHAAPDDELAFRCKIISNIHLNKTLEALTFIDKNPKMAGKLRFEEAYCLYRNQKMVPAKNALDKCEDSPGKKELMTQILYRMEQYAEAYDSCKELIRIATDEYEEERQTNLAAINACLISSGEERRLDKVEYDTHELRYNMGCALIGEGRYQDALKILRDAEAKAVETLREDGFTDEEIAEDTAIITIQVAYCAHKLGREKEALALYSKVLKNVSVDPDMIAVASNNILCINKAQNIFDSKKRVKAMRAEEADLKLTCAQRRDMHLNQCLFYLLTGQADLCKDTIRDTARDFPETSDELFLIETALKVKTEGIEAAKAFIEPNIKKSLKAAPEKALHIHLCFVQQLLRDGKRNDAISILEDLCKDSYKPGIIGALVTLYQEEGRVNDACKTVKQAVDYYRKQQGNKKRLNMLWRQAASLMMQQGDLAEAVKSLEELRKSSPDDIVTLAQLIVAYSQYDIVKAHKLSDELPHVSPPEDLDMAVLESPNWLSTIKQTKVKVKPDSVPSTPLLSGRSTDSGEDKEVRKKKKGKCKSKMPKEIDPERVLDPERWLPKYERAGYRPKKQRRGKVDVGKGTQGADSATSAMYDMTNKVSTLKRETSAPPPKSSPRTEAIKANAKGKKAKSK